MTKPTKWHVRPAKTQISLGIRRTGWSESLLGTHAILLVLSRGGSNIEASKGALFQEDSSQSAQQRWVRVLKFGYSNYRYYTINKFKDADLTADCMDAQADMHFVVRIFRIQVFSWRELLRICNNGILKMASKTRVSQNFMDVRVPRLPPTPLGNI